MAFSTIYEPIREDLIKVENELESVSKVDFAWLAELLEYSVGSGCKGIRPALTQLSGNF